MRHLRLMRLAWSFNRRAALKFTLTCVLIAVGVSVFLVVSELSRASTDSLDQAISEDLGLRNQYTLSFNSDLGISPEELRARTRRAVDRLGPRTVSFVDLLPPTRPACPPYAQQGVVPVYVLRTATGSLARFSGHATGPAGVDGRFDLCLGGQVVPARALRRTTAAEERAFGGGLVIDGAYEPLVQLASPLPTRIACVVQFGGDADRADDLRDALGREFDQTLAQVGTTRDQQITVARADDGAQVRAASDGVRLVYAIIGWGIVLIVGLGILVTQLVVLRDRTWLLGLARAVGARKNDIAMLVAVDVILMLAVGFGAAVLLCLGLQPMVSSFGQQTFQVQLQLVRWGVAPSLLAAVLLTLAVGAGYPMLKAIRLDPVEVLERR